MCESVSCRVKGQGGEAELTFIELIGIMDRYKHDLGGSLPFFVRLPHTEARSVLRDKLQSSPYGHLFWILPKRGKERCVHPLGEIG